MTKIILPLKLGLNNRYPHIPLAVKVLPSDKKQVSFIDYWNTIPPMNVLDEITFKKISQKVRRAIINTLMMGIFDEKLDYQRRVLNAKEIKIETEKILGEKLEKSNLYFHLAELENLGVIQIVDTIHIKGKKRAISYYGRTAKMFILDPPEGKTEFPLLYTNEFLNLISVLNPEKSQEELKMIISEVDKLNNFKFSEIVHWFESHGDTLYNQNLNLADLFEFLGFINRIDKKVLDGFIHIAELLKFKLT